MLPTLLLMQHHEIVPLRTHAPAPPKVCVLPPLIHTPVSPDCEVALPPVRVSFATVAPSSTIARRMAEPAAARMTVFSQPWPTSVTPPVTISCAST